MFRTSLNRRLLVIILLLGAVGLVVTLLQVKEAWDNVAEKGRIAALAQADRVLFDAVIHIRTDRGNVLEVLRQDYVRTAKAKGLAERPVIYKHAVRNAINPLITIFGFEIGGLLSGSAILETVVGWPGL